MRADRATVDRLLKTARGQIDGVLRMTEDDRYCMDIANQIAASEALLRKAWKEVVRAHMRGCVQEAFTSGSESEREQKLEEILKLLDKGS